MLLRFSFWYLTRMANTWAGSAIPAGCRNNPLITLKITAFAPMPSAKVSTATAVKPGFFANMRRPNFRSWNNAFTRILRIELKAIRYQRSSFSHCPNHSALQSPLLNEGGEWC